MCSRVRRPSALLPISTRTLSRVTFLTVPEIRLPILSIYSAIMISRSALRTFCTITCLAVCAAIRPNSMFSIRSSQSSPIFNSSFFSLASSIVNCEPLPVYSSSSTIVHTRKVSYSPVLRSTPTRHAMSSLS